MERKKSGKTFHIVIEVLKPIFIILILGLAYYYFYEKVGFGIPCLFNKLTGYKCPGCGMTHAFAAILKGKFSEAFSYNPLSLTVAPAMAAYLIYKYARKKLGKADGFHIWEYFFLAAVLIAVMLYGYIRNFT